MAKVSFASLKLKTKDDIKTFNIGDKTVEVKQYLSAEDKSNLLEIILQTAMATETVLNTFLIDVLFHTYIVFKYTNLSFTDAQKTDLLKLYDILETNEIIEQVISLIPEIEYNTLRDNLNEMIKLYSRYSDSAKACIDTVLKFAPSSAATLSAELKNLDTEKFQQVIDLAAATGAYNK